MAEITVLQGVNYWFWIGSFALILLTYQDFTRNMRVDDRRNWFMMGVTITLLSHLPRPIWYILAVVALGIGLNILINKLNLLGDGDANTITWLWIGYGFIGLLTLVKFLLVFLSLYVFYMLVKIIIMRIMKVRSWNTPFYIVLLLSFVLTNIINGSYI